MGDHQTAAMAKIALTALLLMLAATVIHATQADEASWTERDDELELAGINSRLSEGSRRRKLVQVDASDEEDSNDEYELAGINSRLSKGSSSMSSSSSMGSSSRRGERRTPPTASPTTFAPTPPTASPTTFAPTPPPETRPPTAPSPTASPTESLPWYNCPKDTDGTCSWFSCDSSRGATCNDNYKCVCNASQCAKGGRCVAKEEYRP